MDCPYCSDLGTRFPLADVGDENGNHVRMVLSGSFLECDVYYETWWTHGLTLGQVEADELGRVPVSFCPMCGRSLVG